MAARARDAQSRLAEHVLLPEASQASRPANITNPMVECGLVVSPARTLGFGGEGDTSTALRDLFNRIEIRHRNLYVCATGIRAGIKTVDFRYNGTDGELSNLKVDQISDKVHQDEGSKPLWAVETSGDQPLWFHPLWGMVNNSYETTDGFYTMRPEKLWLPGVVRTFGSIQGIDSLAAVSSPGLNVLSIYHSSTSDTDAHTGRASYYLVDRFQRWNQFSQVRFDLISDLVC